MDVGHQILGRFRGRTYQDLLGLKLDRDYQDQMGLAGRDRYLDPRTYLLHHLLGDRFAEGPQDLQWPEACVAVTLLHLCMDHLLEFLHHHTDNRHQEVLIIMLFALFAPQL